MAWISRLQLYRHQVSVVSAFATRVPNKLLTNRSHNFTTRWQATCHTPQLTEPWNVYQYDLYVYAG